MVYLFQEGLRPSAPLIDHTILHNYTEKQALKIVLDMEDSGSVNSSCPKTSMAALATPTEQAELIAHRTKHSFMPRDQRWLLSIVVVCASSCSVSTYT
eukprot:1678656-Amphidinium_carterae.1